MTPLGNVVGLVDRDEGEVDAFQSGNELRCVSVDDALYAAGETRGVHG